MRHSVRRRIPLGEFRVSVERMKDLHSIPVLALISILALGFACEQKSGKPAGTKTEGAAKSAAESADQTAAESIKSATDASKTK
jgi:uncharacterized protein (UPF0333 family)